MVKYIPTIKESTQLLVPKGVYKKLLCGSHNPIAGQLQQYKTFVCRRCKTSYEYQLSYSLITQKKHSIAPCSLINVHFKIFFRYLIRLTVWKINQQSCLMLCHLLGNYCYHPEVQRKNFIV